MIPDVKEEQWGAKEVVTSQLHSYRPQPRPPHSCGRKNYDGADVETQWAVPAQARDSRPIRADWRIFFQERGL